MRLRGTNTPGQLIDKILRWLPRHWDSVEAPRGKATGEALDDEGSQMVVPSS